ncbi:MAG: UbiX family flavin prenyltransferase [Candidatus Aenigmatarchaeota archaeon]
MRIAVAITGASGSVVGLRLIEELKKKVEVTTIISDAGEKVLKEETGTKMKADYEEDDIESPLASSSNIVDAFIICPCSVKTLSAVANGYTNNLIIRLADIQLKMRRKLILCIRETPFNLMHIENMRKVTLAGGIIMPLNIAYYSKPKTLDDVNDFFVGKALDLIGIENKLYKRWKE